MRVHVGVCRAAGAGPQFSRNDQRGCRSLITRVCLPIVRPALGIYSDYNATM